MSQNFTLITGASSGIGLDLAAVMAAEGHNLLLIARSMNLLERAASTLAGRHKVHILVFSCDLSKPPDIQALLEFIKEKQLYIEILINNAGFGTYGLFSETDWQSESDMIQVNIHALVHLTKKILPGMIEKNYGRIMNVASTAAFQPGPLMAVYYASKAFVLSFSEALSNELTNTKISVTTLCPGPTKTGFQKTAGLDSSRLMKVTKTSDSYMVAQYGYKKMMLGKRLAIPGFINYISAHLVSLFPRALILKFVRLIQERTKQKIA